MNAAQLHSTFCCDPARTLVPLLFCIARSIFSCVCSGIYFDERYDPWHDATRMLFTAPDTARFASEFPLAHPIDTFWAYSSGHLAFSCLLLLMFCLGTT